MAGRIGSADRAGRATPQAPSGLAPSATIPLREALDELTLQASNLRRYPFESATMNEAARMAADALTNIRRNLAIKWGAE